MSTLVDMNTFRDRLRRAADYAGVDFSPQAIATSLGLKRRQTVARWLEGSVPDPAMIFHISATWKVDPVWLGTGGGDMLPRLPVGLTSREQELLQTYRRLDKEKRASLTSIVNALAKAVVILSTLAILAAPQQASADPFNKTLFARASFLRIACFLRKLLSFMGLDPRIAKLPC